MSLISVFSVHVLRSQLHRREISKDCRERVSSGYSLTPGRLRETRLLSFAPETRPRRCLCPLWTIHRKFSAKAVLPRAANEKQPRMFRQRWVEFFELPSTMPGCPSTGTLRDIRVAPPGLFVFWGCFPRSAFATRTSPGLFSCRPSGTKLRNSSPDALKPDCSAQVVRELDDVGIVAGKLVGQRDLEVVAVDLPLQRF